MSTTLPILQTMVGLCVVTGVIFLLAYSLKKLQQHFPNSALIKVVGGVSLGHKEKLIVIEVENKRLLLGVTSQQIKKLHEFSGEYKTEISIENVKPSFASILKNGLRKS